MNRNYLFPALFLLALPLAAQKAPAKFGKVTADELHQKACPIDPEAHAYYLFDFGKTYLEFTGDQPNLVFSRHFRIKVLDPEGLSLANQAVTLYEYRTRKEHLESLKAVAYNEENGKIVETRMEKNAVFREESDEFRHQTKFAVPNVRPGTVFEVQYEIRSDFITSVNPWLFQYEVPVLRSEYHASLIEHFFYKPLMRGYEPVQVSQEQFARSFSIGGDQVSLLENNYHYVAENMPAFRDEPYLYTRDNYRSMVEFSLSAIGGPFSFRQKIATNWGDVTHWLMEDNQFGEVLRKKSPFRDQAATLKAVANPEQRMRQAFDFVRKHYTWNGRHRLFADVSPGKIAESRNGTSADINLALINLLQEIGLEAWPVTISTRTNGVIFPGQSSVASLNHVIALVKIDTARYYMDASDRYSAINLLPPEDFNGMAIVVAKDGYQQTELKQKNPHGVQSMAELSLTADNRLEGPVKTAYFSYGAYEKRRDIGLAGSPEAHLEDWKKQFPGLECSQYKVDGLEDPDQEVKVEMQASFQQQVEQAGNLLLITPWLFYRLTENPFKSEKRTYPVEFDYPSTTSMTLRLPVPAGYVVESLPKPLRLKLPDGSCKFNCNVVHEEGMITVTAVTQIMRTLYLPNEYADLRQFFQVLVDKQQEKIVLKKS